MKHLRTRQALLFAGASLLTATTIGSSVASAEAGMQTTASAMPRVFMANLAPLNGSGASGVAYIVVQGNTATITTKTSGLSPNLPHAQHIHLGDMAGSCPTIAADANGDGLISVAEAAGNYGPIRVSLTTSGDYSADSALAVTRFPIGGANGMTTYSRTLTLPDGVTADNLGKAEIVQHGISTLFDDPTQYDGAKRSSIAPTLPIEATIPADCGTLKEITPQVMMGMENAGATFSTQIAASMAGLSGPAADQFMSAYTTASQQFVQTLQNAVLTYDQSVMQNSGVAKDVFIDTFNNAKATYFNTLDVAKNNVAAMLNGQNDNQKDTFMNTFNSARDAYGNQLEQAKNDFAAASNL